MRRILSLICAAMAAFLIVFIVPAFAAGQTFSVSGQVIDATGSPVAGANVTLIDNNFNVISLKTTNTEGRYDFINVNSSTDTVTVRVSLEKNGKTYRVPSYYTRWYPAQGVYTIKNEETQFADYPEPTLGYVYGAIKSDDGMYAKFLTGDVYLTSIATGNQYHEYANNTDGTGSFYFHVPPGDYAIYAVHDENGKKTETSTQRITVQPAWNINEHLPVALVIERGLIPLPLHMLPGLRSPLPSTVNAPAYPETGIAALPLLLAALVGILLLACLYLMMRE